MQAHIHTCILILYSCAYVLYVGTIHNIHLMHMHVHMYVGMYSTKHIHIHTYVQCTYVQCNLLSKYIEGHTKSVLQAVLTVSTG